MTQSRRGCVTPDDDLSALDPPVQYSAFNNYIKSACLMECKAMTMMSQCGCLPYVYPDFSMVWNRSTACNATGLKCLNDGEGKTVDRNNFGKINQRYCVNFIFVMLCYSKRLLILVQASELSELAKYQLISQRSLAFYVFRQYPMISDSTSLGTLTLS